MLGSCWGSFRRSAKFGLFAAAALAVLLAGLLTVASSDTAQALPSFARQTGQPCGTCHTDFPGLTPFGRRFKLLGYTTGGGLYKTTPFGNNAGAGDSLRAYARRIDGNGDAPTAAPAGEKGWVPPVSMMAVVGMTHTQAPLASPSDPYKANDNVVLTPFSAFWGGAITNNIGAFAQVTYNAIPAGGFGDPFGHTWTWDNTDVRYANTTNIAGLDVIYGLTANNNPTVQDVWNTTPAWGFPYAASNLASTPGTKTMLEGSFSARMGGVGAYAFINDMLYLEVTGYKTLNFSQQNAVGTDPIGSPGLVDFAPYWRLAFEPHWGPHTFMVGTYGMIFNVHPWTDPGFSMGLTDTFSQTNKFTDIGFDSQYQYQGSNYWLSLRANYLREYQRWDASFNGFAGIGGTVPTNLTTEVNSLKLGGSFAYGGDNRIVLTGQYFNIWGTADLGLYGTDVNGNTLTPNSDGWMAEIAYIPFGTSKAPGWPWFNARIALQYTYYNKFNGTTIGAHDNNTLFLHAWFAM